MNPSEERLSALCPIAMMEYDLLAPALPPRENQLLRRLLLQMPITDLISFPAEMFLRHVRSVMETAEALSYCAAIPEEIFLSYLLPYRVNDERFEPWHALLAAELRPLVQGKPMLEAALAVNEWCMAQATYRSTDDRTLNALAVMRAGFGRCGEETQLAVCALRAAGIPARQCYCPWWAHCDDNHAWVEFWADGRWHYFGACEPQETPDQGWFNYAASKAPVVRHRLLGQSGRSVTRDENRLFTTVDTTAAYGETAEIAVEVTRRGLPTPQIEVYACVMNYGRPCCVRVLRTDAQGIARFVLGKGGFLFFAAKGAEYDLRAADLRRDQKLKLELSRCPTAVEFDLQPAEGILPEIPPAPSHAFVARIEAAAAHRAAAHPPAEGPLAELLERARGNAPVLMAFLQNAALSPAQKATLLATFSDKDFLDLTEEVLADAASSFACVGSDDPLFEEAILPLRVADEPLFPHRAFVRRFFSGGLPQTPAAIWAWLCETIQRADEFAYPGVTGDVCGVLTHRVATSESLPIHFVQICRALGFAARLHPENGVAEYFENGRFLPAEKEKLCRTLLLSNGCHEPLELGSQVTVCAVAGGRFLPQNCRDILPGGGKLVLSLPEGFYAVTHSRRQIDGAVTGCLRFASAGRIEPLTLLPAADKTAEKLFQAPLPAPLASLCPASGPCLLAFLQQHTEPTEHFLNELLEQAQALKAQEIPVMLFCPEGEHSPTLAAVLSKKLGVLVPWADPALPDALRAALHVGDRRLPLCAALLDGRALYGFANYHVGTVRALLHLLELPA